MDIEKLTNVLNALMEGSFIEGTADVKVEVLNFDGSTDDCWRISGVTVNNNGSITLQLFMAEED